MQERCNSIANALELCISWTNQSIYPLVVLLCFVIIKFACIYIYIYIYIYFIYILQGYRFIGSQESGLPFKGYIDGLVQERCNSIALAMELRLSCTNPSIWGFKFMNMVKSWHIVIMMTSSNEPFSALLAICAGNSLVPGEFPTQRPVTRSFDVYFDLRLNKRLSKQSWGWWFEMLLWCHSNDG